MTATSGGQRVGVLVKVCIDLDCEETKPWCRYEPITTEICREFFVGLTPEVECRTVREVCPPQGAG